MTGIVYALLDPVTGEPRYVGLTKQALEKRLIGHVTKARTKETHRDNWIMSLRRRGLRPAAVELMRVNLEFIGEAEQFWIRELRQRGFALTNHTEGGECGNTKYELPLSVRERIGRALRGRKKPPRTPEHSAKLAAANLGKKKKKKEVFRLVFEAPSPQSFCQHVRPCGTPCW